MLSRPYVVTVTRGQGIFILLNSARVVDNGGDFAKWPARAWPYMYYMMPTNWARSGEVRGQLEDKMYDHQHHCSKREAHF